MTAPTPGTVVADTYALDAPLGRGQSGVIFAARHQMTDRPVALKLIHRSVTAKSPEAARRFLREAQATAVIDHPAMVSVLDAGWTPDQQYYLAYEILRGRQLEEQLEDGPISPQQCLQIAATILECLEAAHRRGFVHRDLKPRHIFLEETPSGIRVRLLDFGTAKLAGQDLTRMGEVLGTLLFMSPEQALGGEVDARADLWSLGAVMFRCLTGRAPFAAATRGEVIRRLAGDAAPALGPLRPDLPEELCELVDRALCRAPDDRFADAQEMREAVLDCLDARDETLVSSSASFWADAEVKAWRAAHEDRAAAQLAHRPSDLRAPDDFGRPTPPRAFVPPSLSPPAVAPAGPGRPRPAPGGGDFAPRAPSVEWTGGHAAARARTDPPTPAPEHMPTDEVRAPRTPATHWARTPSTGSATWPNHDTEPNAARHGHTALTLLRDDGLLTTAALAAATLLAILVLWTT